ncbi:hypothetical protein [Deinococcus apachensis]|uniref:hypothetical protein n=1 Tax=Deinococcus apachensis TaxID=309886 RepID=UPI000368FF26|nr:hypothetical protein [Deinococcus apachensis]
MKKRQIPTYKGTHPDHLATAEQLRQQGLKPHPPEPVALLAYQRGDTTGLCGLHERATAVPLEKHPAG